MVCIGCGTSEETFHCPCLPESIYKHPRETISSSKPHRETLSSQLNGTISDSPICVCQTFKEMADYIICIISVFGLHDTYLKDESGGSLFMTVRRRVRRPFFPSHTRLLSVLTRASTSGILAFMEMALSSFNSWLFRRRYLFLKDREHIEKVNQDLIFHLRLKVKKNKIK